MNLLLDTHTLIWFLNGDPFLTDKARSAIESSNNIKFVSMASVWEISIKFSLGKIQIPKGIKHLIALIEDNGFEFLPITLEHLVEVSSLDYFHRDPFDRLLIAQVKIENFTIVTKDENIRLYKIKTLW